MAQPLAALTLGDTTVRQLDGLFSLNDLHAAAGGERKHQPAFFMRRQETRALAAEVGHSADSQSAIRTVNGGTAPGTYACRELVIAYAAWISAAFHLRVIRVFLGAQGPAPSLRNRRWLIDVDHQGNEHHTVVSAAAVVGTPEELAHAIAQGGWGLRDTRLMLDACLTSLQRSAEDIEARHRARAGAPSVPTGAVNPRARMRDALKDLRAECGNTKATAQALGVHESTVKRMGGHLHREPKP